MNILNKITKNIHPALSKISNIKDSIQNKATFILIISKSLGLRQINIW